MKILLASLEKGWGGGQEYLLGLIEGLLKNNDRVVQLVRPKSKSSERFKLEFEYEPLLYGAIDFDYKKLSDWFKLIKNLRTSDLIHIHREHELWLAFVCKLVSPKTKIFYSQHILPRRKFWCLYLCDRVIPVSLYIKKALEELYKSKNIQDVIYPAVSKLLFETIEETKNKTESNFKGAPSLLMSGSYWKEQYKLIPVLKEVLKALPEAHLNFVAPSEKDFQLQELKNLVIAEGIDSHVSFLSSMGRTDYLELVKNTDMFVYSHTREAFGIAVMEACLLGKTVICFNSGALPEIAGKYDKGILIEHTDSYVKAFSEAIIRTYQTDDYKRKSQNLNELKNYFSEFQMIEKHIEAYKECLNFSPPSN